MKLDKLHEVIDDLQMNNREADFEVVIFDQGGTQYTVNEIYANPDIAVPTFTLVIREKK